MSWIRLAAAGFALCASAGAANAQGTPAPQPQGTVSGLPQGAPRGRAMLFEGITLTEAQQKQVDDINASYREQIAALRGPSGAPLDDATRAKLKDLRAKHTAEIRAVLTAEQQVIFDKNFEQGKKRSEEHGKRAPGGR